MHKARGERGKNMRPTLIINLVIVFVLSIAISTSAQQHLITPPYIFYDARDYQDLIYGRGGAEGHSGAYIQLTFSVSGWDAIQVMDAKAKHEDSGFEVTLREDSSCRKKYPPPADASFSVMLRAEDWWMTGEWKLILKYKENGVKKTEEATVVVPRFNFPPIPTGIEIGLDLSGKKYILWNRIGDPGTSGKHVEYRVRHFNPSLPCIDEDIVINANNPGGYQLWSGNRIAVPLPTHWEPGDRVRIENRVYDDNSPSGPYRWDRACKDFILR